MSRVGRVDPGLVRAEEARLAALGAAPPDGGESGPAQVTAATRALAARAGGQVVASGGTTGRIKLTTIAPDQGVPRLLRSWRPLRPGDVLLNLFRPGRLWGAHYFYNALATHCRASVLPMGPVPDGELSDWTGVFDATGVNALAGAPSALADFADAVRAAGAQLPVTAVVWAGEPLTPARRLRIERAFPTARMWGNYGSIETYVIATSRPECAPGVLHLLPDQELAYDAEGTWLTRVGAGWPAPAVRYRLGDRIDAVTGCPCGGGDALRVLGRTDDRLKFHNTMVRLGDLLEAARAVPGVADAQLLLTRDPAAEGSLAGLTVRWTGHGPGAGPAPPGSDAVRAALLRHVYALGVIAAQHPHSVGAERAARLERNTRTGKVVPYVWRSGPAPAGTG
ncbi:AMP-binding protein [Streptomyces sp. DH12]|uniref:AMP-binding protein n=1 Tax=Streptomyces sp. DH12 TaxID=2857010 RepID=UPI001E4B8188|nr:AMP-binding protein [Streptomyces sp. DH12]